MRAFYSANKALSILRIMSFQIIALLVCPVFLWENVKAFSAPQGRVLRTENSTKHHLLVKQMSVSNSPHMSAWCLQ